MSVIICTTCGKAKEVRGTSGGTAPLPEAMAVKEWCTCPKIPDWWAFTFAPPEIIVQKDVELAELRETNRALLAQLDKARAWSAMWRNAARLYRGEWKAILVVEIPDEYELESYNDLMAGWSIARRLWRHTKRTQQSAKAQ